MRISIVTSAAVLAVSMLAGCSTNQHLCPLEGAEEGSPACRTMLETYEAARNVPAHAAPKLTVFDQVAPSTPQPTTPIVKNMSTPTFASANGTPVYAPGKVHLGWTSPYTDAAGVMHGGEFVYFTTPGTWAYGTLNAPGAAAGLFSPVPPTTYDLPRAAPNGQPSAAPDGPLQAGTPNAQTPAPADAALPGAPSQPLGPPAGTEPAAGPYERLSTPTTR